jgi:AcrR family transcriptional regulator
VTVNRGCARPTRKDAQRSFDRIVAAAATAIAAEGATASLEEIARRAGVGSATLHRHFATRLQLLEVVFIERVVAMCAEAERAAEEADPAVQFVDWLRHVGAYVAATRGLATALMSAYQQAPTFDESSCYCVLRDAGARLLARAQAEGAVATEVSIVDLLHMVYAFSLLAEQGIDGSADVDRMLLLSLRGIAPSVVRAEAVSRPG